MVVFKCKMCGGDLNVNKDDSVATCEFCGTKQTLPKLDNDIRTNLFNRANHYRLIDDYDKAQSIYEKILIEDSGDAEAYWSIVLCKYGIKYVDDPKTKRKIPTINRTQIKSILNDDDYLSALKYADDLQKEVYIESANQIDQIQKGILEISRQQEKYDIFICYKETDDYGKRTRDSVLANEIYTELTKNGYKVFFSKISLQGKLGTSYEPCIFSALHSSSIMIVIGTNKDYLNSTWVKNEWSRYLSLISSGEEKTLIPAYKEMDPYDFPEEFSGLQALDMDKLGFIQDLIEGINKLLNKNDSKNGNIEKSDRNDVSPLIKRISLFLDDGDFENAKEYSERVLDEDPENYYPYFAKLLCDYKLRKKEDLTKLDSPFSDNMNFKKVIKYSNKEFGDELIFINNEIINRNKYESCLEHFSNIVDIEGCYECIKEFNEIIDYKDSKTYVQKCKDLLVEIPIKDKYVQACILYNQAFVNENCDCDFLIENLSKAVDIFTGLDYKDSDDMIRECNLKINELNKIKLKRKEIEKANDINNKSKKKKRLIIFTVVGIIAVICVAGVVVGVNINNRNIYLQASALLENKDFYGAYDLFSKISYYSDSKDKADYSLNKGQISEIKTMNKYDMCNFGSYYVTGNSKKEVLEWYVISISSDKALLLSKNVVYLSKYGLDDIWKTSDVREYLNNTFYESAFDNNYSKEAVLDNSTVCTEWDYPENLSYTVNDKVFIFSYDEVVNKYSIAKSILKSSTNKFAMIKANQSYWIFDSWWLREPKYPSGVDNVFNGVIDEDSLPSDSGHYIDGVRPSIWVNLK